MGKVAYIVAILHVPADQMHRARGTRSAQGFFARCAVETVCKAYEAQVPTVRCTVWSHQLGLGAYTLGPQDVPPILPTAAMAGPSNFDFTLPNTYQQQIEQG